MQKKPSRNIVPSQGGMLQDLVLRLKLIFRLILDKRVSPWLKIIPIFALIYWISPVDLIMGIPGLDAVDDIAVLWFGQYLFIELCPSDVVREHMQQLSSNNTIVEEERQKAAEDDVVDGEATDLPDSK